MLHFAFLPFCTIVNIFHTLEVVLDLDTLLADSLTSITSWSWSLLLSESEDNSVTCGYGYSESWGELDIVDMVED
jgi:hypothetical protein